MPDDPALPRLYATDLPITEKVLRWLLEKIYWRTVEDYQTDK